jgi:hypothetical protein
MLEILETIWEGYRCGCKDRRNNNLGLLFLQARKRPTNPFLSGSVVWSPVSSGFQISPDEVVHERVGAVVA